MDDPVTLVVDGKPVRAERGRPVAAALVASGRLTFGRSVKYHRPRGPMCFEGRCDGCLMRVDGIPNVMTCKVPSAEGMKIETQNVIGSARLDLLSATDWFFPEGMDHNHMFTRFGPINKLMQKVARRIAGVGKLPSRVVSPQPPREVETDVLVIGAGRSGILAANAAAQAGARVLLAEELRVGGTRALLRQPVPALGPPVTVHHGAALAVHREPGVGFPDGGHRDEERVWVVVEDGPRLLRVRPHAIIVATGTIDGPVPVPANDRPGVFSARGLLRLVDMGVLPVPLNGGKRAVLVGEGPLLECAQQALERLNCTVLGPFASDQVSFEGRPAVERVRVGATTRDCDFVVMGSPESAAYELARQAGARLAFDGRGFYVLADDHGRTAVPGVFAVGRCTGRSDPARAEEAGRLAAGPVGGVGKGVQLPVLPPCPVPEQDSDKIVVCRCEDVTLHAIEEAVARGHVDIESVKRYTGFATGWCQGKQCVALAARMIAAAGGETAVAPITPRPPVHPIPLSALARLVHPAPSTAMSHSGVTAKPEEENG